ncbi:MAG: DUF1858 domain-containing protein [Firmicutes bacterium]|nr:DUF1858 domain-containing protein [Bacillota bacterium]
MTRVIDLNKTIYELVQEFPELVEIMVELGFDRITNPTMLKTVGRVMTLPKGATMRSIDLETVKEKLIEKGYSLIS